MTSYDDLHLVTLFLLMEQSTEAAIHSGGEQIWGHLQTSAWELRTGHVLKSCYHWLSDWFVDYCLFIGKWVSSDFEFDVCVCSPGSRLCRSTQERVLLWSKGQGGGDSFASRVESFSDFCYWVWIFALLNLFKNRFKNDMKNPSRLSFLGGFPCIHWEKSHMDTLRFSFYFEHPFHPRAVKMPCKCYNNVLPIQHLLALLRVAPVSQLICNDTYDMILKQKHLHGSSSLGSELQTIKKLAQM